MRLFLLSLAWIVVGQVAGLAHDPGISTAWIGEHAGKIELRLTFAERDARAITAALNLPDGDLNTLRRTLAAVSARLARITQGPVVLAPSGHESEGAPDDDAVYLLITYDMPAGSGRAWEFQADALALLPGGHRQLVGFGTEGAAPGIEALLDARHPTFRFTTVAGAPAAATAAATPLPTVPGSIPPFGAFFVLGMEHIATGYDHLLFLLALMVVCTRTRELLLVVTSFTVAHSVTLALAAFDVVHLPGNVVEPLIAASIVVVGVENLLRRGPSPFRPAVTFAFGLVHGFGFAGLLREALAGVSGSELVGPLVGFNLGIETGQIAIAALTFPVLAWLRSRPSGGQAVIPVTSALVVLAGGYWFVTRVAGI